MVISSYMLTFLKQLNQFGAVELCISFYFCFSNSAGSFSSFEAQFKIMCQNCQNFKTCIDKASETKVLIMILI